MKPVDRERGVLTAAEQSANAREIAVLEDEAKALGEQASELESQAGQKRAAARSLLWKNHYASLLEDPLICEPHGVECVQEPPGPMSVGAMIHIEDGEVCYAASLGRRSKFTDEDLAVYRRMKAGK